MVVLVRDQRRKRFVFIMQEDYVSMDRIAKCHTMSLTCVHEVTTLAAMIHQETIIEENILGGMTTLPTTMIGVMMIEEEVSHHAIGEMTTPLVTEEMTTEEDTETTTLPAEMNTHPETVAMTIPLVEMITRPETVATTILHVTGEMTIIPLPVVMTVMNLTHPTATTETISLPLKTTTHLTVATIMHVETTTRPETVATTILRVTGEMIIIPLLVAMTVTNLTHLPATTETMSLPLKRLNHLKTTNLHHPKRMHNQHP
jgi:hypothetical protein